jgi:hypothetical protein
MFKNHVCFNLALVNFTARMNRTYFTIRNEVIIAKLTAFIPLFTSGNFVVCETTI